MFGIVLNSLRSRKAGFAGAFLALFCAAALVCACGILLDTGLRGKISPERLAGAPIVVSGDQYVHAIKHKKGKTKKKAKPIAERAWIDAALADRLRSAPGVRSVVTEVTFPAEIPGVRAEASWGHGWESAPLTPFTLRSGRAPTATDEVVLDAATARTTGLSAGSQVTVRTTTAPRTYKVVGVTAQGLDHQAALFFATDEARRLAAHPGKVSAIGVFPAGADVTSAVGATVHTGDARGKVEFLGAEKARVKLISMGGALGGTSLLVAILVVVGTFALSIQQRQREIALLRAIAATPRQIRKMIGREALLVSLAAGALGAAAGPLLAFWLRTKFVDLGAMPRNLDLVLSPFPMFAGVLATIAAAWTAARISARRLTRIRPVEALGDADLQPPRLGVVRILAGLATLGGAVTLTLVLSVLSTEAASSPVTMLTAIVWVVAVAILGPFIARAAVWLLSLPLRGSRGPGHLASANLRTGAARLAAVITPLSLMVALTSTILFVQTTMGNAANEQSGTGTLATQVLGPKVPHTAVEEARKVPGVTAATEVLHTTLRVGLTNHRAQGVTPQGLAKTMDLGVRSGSLARLGLRTVAVSRTMNKKVGDTLSLTLGDGTPATLQVIAVYSRGLGFGDLTLSHDLLSGHVDDSRADSVLVAGTARRAALAAALRGYPGIAVQDRTSVAIDKTNAEANYVAMGLIIAFTAIAVVNTLAMATADRAREFALLRLVGTTRRQVMRMLRWETLVVATTALTIGTGIALITLTAFSKGMTGSAAPHIPLPTYLGVIGAAGALALAATVLPARLALRSIPAEAISSRE